MSDPKLLLLDEPSAGLAPVVVQQVFELVKRIRAGGLTVLIVDDNQDAAEMLSEYVGSLGYRVWTAFDGPSALRVALETSPAIALLDIGLPVMDGFELAGRLRELRGKGELKLVAITGYGQESDRERSRSAGFDAHLVKPVDMDALEDLLRVLSTPS